MKPIIAIAGVFLLLSGSARAEVGLHSRPAAAANPPHNNRSWQDSTGRDKIQALGIGFRVMGFYHSGNQEYVERQMSQYDIGGNELGAPGAQLVFNVGYRGLLAELETVFDDATNRDVFGGSHNIELSADQNNVWLRYRWRVFGTPLFLSPGASVGQTNAELIIWDKNRVDDAGRPVSSVQLLLGSGTTYALGVMSEIGFVSGFAVALDYRYRFAKITDVKSLNGGEFFFPSDPELDFSRHSFAIGVSTYFTLPSWSE